jgi:DNA polymerase gamma 1
MLLAKKALQMNPEEYKNHRWLSNLDSSVKVYKRKVTGFDPYKKVYERKDLSLAPKWFKDLWDANEKRIRITTSKRAVPYLLQLCWKGYPLYYTSSFGWTFVVPKNQVSTITEKPIVFDSNPDSPKYDHKASLDSNHHYFRLPHPDGEGHNCGNPLARSFLIFFENGTLTSAYDDAKEILDLNSQCSYWISARQRILDQFVVWNDSDYLLGFPDDGGGVILPQSVVMGTVTRRAVEPTVFIFSLC